MPKFYRTIFTFDVVTRDEPYHYYGLNTLAYDGTDGEYSVNMVSEQVIELTPKEAAQALMTQSSDPEYLGIDEDGNDLEEVTL
jgi:hypothetical protein